MTIPSTPDVRAPFDIIRTILDRLQKHKMIFDWDNVRHACICGKWCDSGPGERRVHCSYDIHLSEEVADALGLTSEWFARHASGGGCGGFNSLSDAARYIDLHPAREGGVESPPDPGYVGVEHRLVTRWEIVDEG